MANKISKNTFGYYKADKSTNLLQAITKLGISRGVVRKFIAKRWKEKGYKVVDTTNRKINYRLHIGENTTDEKVLTSSKFYDKKEIFSLANAIKDTSKIDSVFVDIGANTGYYSLNLAKLGYSKIIAIEPNPATLEILIFNIKANNMNPKIKVIPMCIGDGKDVLFYCSSGLGSASVFKECHDKSEPITVRSQPLLEILQQEEIRSIDGMKIDIEGFEDKALLPFFNSAPKSLWPKIIILEDCNNDLWEDDILSKMRSIGYEVQDRTRANLILKLKSTISLFTKQA